MDEEELGKFARGRVSARRSRLGLIIALAAFGAASRLAFLGLPNVAPIYLVAFLSGVAFGWRTGFAAGFLGMAVTNLLLSGLHPVMLVNTVAMGLLGVAGDWAGRFVNFGQRSDEPLAFVTLLCFLTGLLATLAFSVLADAITFLLFYREAWSSAAAPSAFLALAAAGLVFNLIPAVINGAIFALGGYPVLRALRNAGFIPHSRTHAPPVEALAR